MDQFSLSRQEKGRLADLIAQGLFDDVHESVKATVKEHVHERYDDLLEEASVRVRTADIDSYRWFDDMSLSVPGDVGWRPDFFVKCQWSRKFSKDEPPEKTFWDQNLPPIDCRLRLGRLRLHGRRREILRCTFTVYYPVEVKSGTKKTLTDQQAIAIPAVVNAVDHVHPIIVSIDIDDLPASYSMEVAEFATSEWSSEGGPSRYQS